MNLLVSGKRTNRRKFHLDTIEDTTIRALGRVSPTSPKYIALARQLYITRFVAEQTARLRADVGDQPSLHSIGTTDLEAELEIVARRRWARMTKVEHEQLTRDAL